jgi:protein TonB
VTPYSSSQSQPRRLIGLGVVAVLHGAAIYGLATGLGRQAVEFLKAPVESKVVAELIKPPEPPKVEPPLPKAKAPPKPPPPAYVPPPRIKAEMPAPNAIAAVTQEAPKEPPPPPAPAVQQIQKSAPALDTGQSCPPPKYPPAARRAGESGAVVLRFLIEEDGSVADSLVDASSGFERLDEAARTALANCHFKPGTIDGRPERSWAQIRYVWKLQ